MIVDRFLAVVPVRHGVLPLGADEAVAEAGGSVVLVGSGGAIAAADLAGIADQVWSLELGEFEPAGWARAIAAALPAIDRAIGHVVLPGSPDGRDLGPHLAAVLDRSFVAAAIAIDGSSAEITRHGGRLTELLSLPGPVVASLQPGVRGVERSHRGDDEAPTVVELGGPGIASESLGPTLVEELPADPSTMDLAEADRIVGGGAGLGAPEAFDELRALAARLTASPGGTRVVTDWGWLPVERQIGTTGVAVDPSLYLAIGISGAVQHTAGLGSPEHIISVNTDPYCPMMSLADLAVVCDGRLFLQELLARLGDD